MSDKVKERPIPYSAVMIRALRAGMKTNTRRMINPQPEMREGGQCRVRINGNWNLGPADFLLRDAMPRFGCPYGQPGDRLWTREAWRTTAGLDHLPPRDIPMDAPIWYEADGPAPAPQFGRYRHARFMCRWMSRGLDEVTDIRVERLQDISEEDAKVEGITPYKCGWSNGEMGPFSHPVLAFFTLWDSINGDGSSDANPWVWVIEFKRVETKQ
ncbi:hypothetical protein [Microbulbifer discodermiae]|uniref:hypothetical protein n=1 Tax=Microbulbifer sp. 2201CG32-9 TaxID=3232309 RepID=UPI00345BD5A0